MFGLVARLSSRTLFPKRDLIVCCSLAQNLRDKTVLFNTRLSSDTCESRARQNFNKDCEDGINKHINWELYASYVYQSMYCFFDRDDVALPGFTKYFKKASDEEKEHAETFMRYQNKRGGRVVLEAIPKPEKGSWESGLEAMKAALTLEKAVNQSLLDLHKCAGEKGDAQLQDFIESEFLGEQVDAIKEISDYITNLSQVGPGHGEWHFDKTLADKCGK